jgi:hypothetical protein
MSQTGSASRADWTDMTPSQWMDLTTGDWMRMAYGDWMERTPQQLVEAMYSAGRPAPTRQPDRHRGHHHRHDCGCDDCHHHRHEHGHGEHRHEHQHDHGHCPRCGPDSCECFCCIGDVDLAVYARFGEQRVIPIVIENERRREKQITLELSGWSSRGGKESPVSTVVLTPEQLTLAPCEEKEILLVVRVADLGQPGSDDNPEETGRTRRLPDVDDCVVAVADLRLEGCDHRPLRIAVAILPRTCDPYRVGCGCSCC